MSHFIFLVSLFLISSRVVESIEPTIDFLNSFLLPRLFGPVSATFPSERERIFNLSCTDTRLIRCNGGAIEMLNLSSASLFGSIPNEIGLFTSLVSLQLADNFLDGEIPDSIANLTRIETLNLSTNLLRGSLPAGVKALLNMQILDLSNNRLEGTVPSLTTLVHLKSLHLYHNFLSGSVGFLLSFFPIPDCVINLIDEFPPSASPLQHVTSTTSLVSSSAANDFSCPDQPDLVALFRNCSLDFCLPENGGNSRKKAPVFPASNVSMTLNPFWQFFFSSLGVEISESYSESTATTTDSTIVSTTTSPSRITTPSSTTFFSRFVDLGYTSASSFLLPVAFEASSSPPFLSMSWVLPLFILALIFLCCSLIVSFLMFLYWRKRKAKPGSNSSISSRTGSLSSISSAAGSSSSRSTSRRISRRPTWKLLNAPEKPIDQTNLEPSIIVNLPPPPLLNLSSPYAAVPFSSLSPSYDGYENISAFPNLLQKEGKGTETETEKGIDEGYQRGDLVLSSSTITISREEEEDPLRNELPPLPPVIQMEEQEVV